MEAHEFAEQQTQFAAQQAQLMSQQAFQLAAYQGLGTFGSQQGSSYRHLLKPFVDRTIAVVCVVFACT